MLAAATLSGWAARIVFHSDSHFSGKRSAAAASFTPELIVSESFMAPVPRPPQPMIPSRSSRRSSAAANDECTIAADIAAVVVAVNDRLEIAGWAC